MSTPSPNTPLPPPTPAVSPQARRVLPFIVGCALFMQMLDSTVVTTALPTMALALDSDPVSLNIAITSYLLSLAVFVPISGWAADRYGARKVFMIAIGIFTLSSLACALSATLLHLVLSRIAQGMGGAMMVPVGRIILLRTIPKHDLLRAMAFLSMPALIGPLIGPPLGGFLVTYASWHWIFLINLPIGLFGIWMVRRYVIELPPDGLRHPLDFAGFLLSALCMACLMGGFEALGTSQASWALTAGLIATGITTGALYYWHSKRCPHPILDLTLLNIPTFRASMLAGNLCRFTIGSSPFLMAILLQVGFGLSAISAGMITFAGAIGSMAMKFVAPPILRRWGYRKVLTINGILTAACTVLCIVFTPATPVFVISGVLLLGGFFRSLQFTAVNTLTFADVSHAGMSRASSFAAMGQQLGVSMGVGVAACTLNISMSWRHASELATTDVTAGFIVIGLICASASLLFWRMDPLAGESLHRR
jgi:EmrB/QacA subfamily drug resistance transporter